MSPILPPNHILVRKNSEIRICILIFVYYVHF
nr:MAG TPA: hypothetical protein [Caudoviricetes sp.]